MEDILENKWAVKLLKANGALMLELLELAAKSSDTQIDDALFDILGPQLLDWIEGLEIPQDLL